MLRSMKKVSFEQIAKILLTGRCVKSNGLFFTFLWLFITFYLLLDIKHLFLFLFTYIIESEIGEHMKIAVCEDNEADLLVLRQELEIYFSSRLMGQGSVMYYCFSNGEDFLADSEGFKYDLIVLDIYMDFMNGMDVAYNYWSLY